MLGSNKALHAPSPLGKALEVMPVAERLWPKIYLYKHRIMVGCRAYSVLFKVDLLRCILPFLGFGRGFFRPIEVGQYAKSEAKRS